ncbi:hypothetical protein [Paramicrobacterium fandaimingii]|uniref:hypothetical protein n=1 Tax=Paramicrobacterium fandaimingii TaxID=2708079 RepID=UPI00141DDF95|nr:hypothetical protein [Microbacterium fandaimingii]
MTQERSDSILALRRSSIPFLWVGTAAIIVGGLVAAITSPLKLEHGSWASAYLVLIVGIALIFFGVTQSLLTERATRRTIAIEIGAWVLGSLAVLGGTLVSQPAIVDIGGAVLVIALIVFALAVRTRGRTRATLPLWVFRFVLLVMIISIPIGLVLSHLRH